MTTTELDLLRSRSGDRNFTLDINRIPEPYEVFVHNLILKGGEHIEVHFPIEWVCINADGQTVFNADALGVLSRARQLAEYPRHDWLR